MCSLKWNAWTKSCHTIRRLYELVTCPISPSLDFFSFSFYYLLIHPLIFPKTNTGSCFDWLASHKVTVLCRILYISRSHAFRWHLCVGCKLPLLSKRPLFSQPKMTFIRRNWLVIFWFIRDSICGHFLKCHVCVHWPLLQWCQENSKFHCLSYTIQKQVDIKNWNLYIEEFPKIYIK